jgi:hypothetical protein
VLAPASPPAVGEPSTGGAGLVKLPLSSAPAAKEPPLRSDPLPARVAPAVLLEAHEPLPLLVNNDEPVQPDVLLVLPICPAMLRLLMLLTLLASTLPLPLRVVANGVPRGAAGSRELRGVVRLPVSVVLGAGKGLPSCSVGRPSRGAASCGCSCISSAIVTA